MGDAWAKIEERHPDVVVSLSGAQQKGRELETAAVATAVARPSSNVTAARWGGGAEGAPVLVVGTAAGQVLLYEPVATTGYVQDAESQATLVPFEALDTEDAEAAPKAMRKRKPSRAGPAAIGAASDVSRASRTRRVGWSWPPRRRARGRRRGLPVGLRGGPAAAAGSRRSRPNQSASAVALSSDGRWLAVASAENITLHRLPESQQQEEPAALGQISEEAAQEDVRRLRGGDRQGRLRAARFRRRADAALGLRHPNGSDVAARRQTRLACRYEVRIAGGRGRRRRAAPLRGLADGGERERVLPPARFRWDELDPGPWAGERHRAPVGSTDQTCAARCSSATRRRCPR